MDCGLCPFKAECRGIKETMSLIGIHVKCPILHLLDSYVNEQLARREALAREAAMLRQERLRDLMELRNILKDCIDTLRDLESSLGDIL